MKVEPLRTKKNLFENRQTHWNKKKLSEHFQKQKRNRNNLYIQTNQAFGCNWACKRVCMCLEIYIDKDNELYLIDNCLRESIGSAALVYVREFLLMLLNTNSDRHSCSTLIVRWINLVSILFCHHFVTYTPRFGHRFESFFFFNDSKESQTATL